MTALELLLFLVRSITQVVGDRAMWIEKLYEGVLRVLTPLGPRYVKPSFLERIYLFWIFRNFPTLPVNVLSTTQKKRIERICAGHGFLSHIGTYPEADF